MNTEIILDALKNSTMEPIALVNQITTELNKDLEQSKSLATVGEFYTKLDNIIATLSVEEGKTIMGGRKMLFIETFIQHAFRQSLHETRAFAEWYANNMKELKNFSLHGILSKAVSLHNRQEKIDAFIDNIVKSFHDTPAAFVQWLAEPKNKALIESNVDNITQYISQENLDKARVLRNAMEIRPAEADVSQPKPVGRFSAALQANRPKGNLKPLIDWYFSLSDTDKAIFNGFTESVDGDSFAKEFQTLNSDRFDDFHRAKRYAREIEGFQKYLQSDNVSEEDIKANIQSFVTNGNTYIDLTSAIEWMVEKEDVNIAWLKEYSDFVIKLPKGDERQFSSKIADFIAKKLTQTISESELKSVRDTVIALMNANPAIDGFQKIIDPLMRRIADNPRLLKEQETTDLLIALSKASSYSDGTLYCLTKALGQSSAQYGQLKNTYDTLLTRVQASESIARKMVLTPELLYVSCFSSGEGTGNRATRENRIGEAFKQAIHFESFSVEEITQLARSLLMSFHKEPEKIIAIIDGLKEGKVDKVFRDSLKREIKTFLGIPEKNKLNRELLSRKLGDVAGKNFFKNYAGVLLSSSDNDKAIIESLMIGLEAPKKQRNIRESMVDGLRRSTYSPSNASTSSDENSRASIASDGSNTSQMAYVDTIRTPENATRIARLLLTNPVDEKIWKFFEADDVSSEFSVAFNLSLLQKMTQADDFDQATFTRVMEFLQSVPTLEVTDDNKQSIAEIIKQLSEVFQQCRKKSIPIPNAEQFGMTLTWAMDFYAKNPSEENIDAARTFLEHYPGQRNPFHLWTQSTHSSPEKLKLQLQVWLSTKDEENIAELTEDQLVVKVLEYTQLPVDQDVIDLVITTDATALQTALSESLSGNRVKTNVLLNVLNKLSTEALRTFIENNLDILSQDPQKRGQIYKLLINKDSLSSLFVDIEKKKSEAFDNTTDDAEKVSILAEIQQLPLYFRNKFLDEKLPAALAQANSVTELLNTAEFFVTNMPPLSLDESEVYWVAIDAEFKVLISKGGDNVQNLVDDLAKPENFGRLMQVYNNATPATQKKISDILRVAFIARPVVMMNHFSDWSRQKEREFLITCLGLGALSNDNRSTIVSKESDAVLDLKKVYKQGENRTNTMNWTAQNATEIQDALDETEIAYIERNIKDYAFHQAYRTPYDRIRAANPSFYGWRCRLMSWFTDVSPSEVGVSAYPDILPKQETISESSLVDLECVEKLRHTEVVNDAEEDVTDKVNSVMIAIFDRLAHPETAQTKFELNALNSDEKAQISMESTAIEQLKQKLVTEDQVLDTLVEKLQKNWDESDWSLFETSLKNYVVIIARLTLAGEISEATLKEYGEKIQALQIDLRLSSKGKNSVLNDLLAQAILTDAISAIDTSRETAEKVLSGHETVSKDANVKINQKALLAKAYRSILNFYPERQDIEKKIDIIIEEQNAIIAQLGKRRVSDLKSSECQNLLNAYHILKAAHPEMHQFSNEANALLKQIETLDESKSDNADILKQLRERSEFETKVDLLTNLMMEGKAYRSEDVAQQRNYLHEHFGQNASKWTIKKVQDDRNKLISQFHSKDSPWEKFKACITEDSSDETREKNAKQKLKEALKDLIEHSIQLVLYGHPSSSSFNKVIEILKEINQFKEKLPADNHNIQIIENLLRETKKACAHPTDYAISYESDKVKVAQSQTAAESFKKGERGAVPVAETAKYYSLLGGG
jgi:hypothetical protein